MTSGQDGQGATATNDAVGIARRTLSRGGRRTSRSEAHGHEHRDVSGGWLRPAVFGAMDGLVTNVSLIAGVGGAGVHPQTIVLTGLAGLAAGAFSMATGEYVSVSSQNELVAAEVSKEKYELEHHPEAERRELAAVFRRRGVDADLADQIAMQVSDRPEEALRMHVREELGVDHHELPSPYVAAFASLVTFAAGALIPLFPYLVGFKSLAGALVLAAIVAFAGGGLVSRITNRPFWFGALRQLLLAGFAAGLTYAIGAGVHAAMGPSL
jgi:vacuolar iron transporter family protein